MEDLEELEDQHLLLLNRLLGISGPHDTQEALVDSLVEEGSLRSPDAIAAFKAVDQRFFFPATGMGDFYMDAPKKVGKMHHSAPSVYAKVVEALELKPGMSFLNIGSGTGYLSAVVAQLIGPRAVNIGLERHRELVEHARRQCGSLGLNIEFITGNCWNIDVDSSMKFDRVYIGAGAPREARFLYKLLKYDGVVVGPLEDDEGAQSLTKARCRGGKKYAVMQLLQVTFAGLVKPGEDDEEGAAETDRQAVALRAPVWGISRRSIFPESFCRTVMLLYWMDSIDGSLPGRLPWELWAKYVVPMLAWDAFEPPAEEVHHTCATCGAEEPKMQCSRCRHVFYCNRECQRQHWGVHKARCGG